MLHEAAGAFALGEPLRGLADRRASPPPAAADWRDPRTTPSLPLEFAALERAGVSPGPLLAALAEAAATGVAPFDALLVSGGLDESLVIEALARGIGIGVATQADLDGPPISAEEFAVAMRDGRLWFAAPDGKLRLVVRAGGANIAHFVELRRGEHRDMDMALASPRLFADIAVARAGARLAARAAEGPASVCPRLTVAHGLPKPGRSATIALCLLVAAAVFAFEAAIAFVVTCATAFFIVHNLFRLFIVATPPVCADASPRIADRDLPTYTILAPLAREASVLPELLAAIEALDYPAAKLDIKILIEADDQETGAALEARPPRPGVEVIRVPPGGPRTKPRALNAGLLAARGAYLTIFDAEDRPEPGQLRDAVAAFRSGPCRLGCVQARLAIDNHAEGWLARNFAIEYAALFDVTIPALAALGLPIPLGGTSNHFRTSVLRSVGGWDAAHVTEDADLGLRLARRGWSTGAIDSVTWEEAPTDTWIWMKQRTRWMKGFIVTALIHARDLPAQVRRQGLAGALAGQLLVGGVALTALAYPPVLAVILFQLLSGALSAHGLDLVAALPLGVFVANFILGYSAALGAAWIGLDRRDLQAYAGQLFLLPVYWLLVGAAAWRALWQIARSQTSRWEKTPHGLSRSRATP